MLCAMSSFAQFCPSCQVSMTSPAGTKFWLYTPPGYVMGTPAPMLIGLHGQGQIGDNISWLTTQVNDGTPAYLIAQSKWPSARPFIVVSPQLKYDGTNPPSAQDWDAAYIDEVMEYVKTLRTINTNKVYITGLSLGGQGCMIYGAAYPNKIAGMVTISGRTNDIITSACSLVNIPMWMFHGTEDTFIVPSHTINMVNAINECANPGTIRPHFTLIDAARHNTPAPPLWNQIYDQTTGYLIYEWLNQFSKNDASNKPPYVNAGPDKKILLVDGIFFLTSEVFDADGTITTLQWSKLSGPSVTLENTNTNILKATNLQVGMYQFELRASDNLGVETTDQVTITIINSAPTTNIVTDLYLINGANNSQIKSLANEEILNKATMGVTEFNIRAQYTSANSLRFRINSNQNTRIIYTGSNANAFIIDPTPVPEWQMAVGDYVVCATPYSGTNGTGTDGITKCVKISVFDQPIVQYYPKANEDLSLLQSWGTVTGGTGTPPTSFTGNFQVFNVDASAPQDGAWTVGGIESYLYVRDGGELTVNNSFNGVINVEGNGKVTVNTNQPILFGSVSPTSTITFGSSAATIPSVNYGNVAVQAGSLKTLPSGTLSIAGNLVIENEGILQGADNTSTIHLGGNFTLVEESVFQPPVKFGLTLNGLTPQVLNLGGTKVSLRQLTVGSTTTVVNGVFPVELELGSATGGGLLVQTNNALLLNGNNLTIIGQGSINSNNETGTIAFDHSRLSITSTSSSDSHLHAQAGKDSLSSLLINLPSSSLSLESTLFITDSVKAYNGAIQSNGYLAFVSTETNTARLSRFEGTGSVTGNVQFQRSVKPGRNYRYLGFPVIGFSVDSLQEYVPVTGNFIGTSTGTGLTTNQSLFWYDEPTGWKPFPVTDSTEQFTLGTGYSVFVREEDSPTKIIAHGEIHQGDFVATVDSGTASDSVGWNLLANPYLSPIQWANGGWSTTSINSSVYIRDNDAGGFLMWDGADGDIEFGGTIAVGQSFWVKSPAPGAALTITEQAKVVAQPSLYRTQGTESTLISLKISLQHENQLDRAYLKLNDKTGYAFNALLDGLKRKNDYYTLSVLSSDDVTVGIKNIPDACETTMNLALEDTKPGRYSLSFAGSFFEAQDRALVISDTFLDSIIHVQPNELYLFDITENNQSFGKSRFAISLHKELEKPTITVQGSELVSDHETGNQWFLNGEEVEGATSSTYTPTISGDYQVQITTSTCSTLSEPMPFLVTGIENNSGISIYPNPADKLLFITGSKVPITYAIQNLLGQQVQQGTVVSELDRGIELRVAAGVYILTAESGQHAARFKLIVR